MERNTDLDALRKRMDVMILLLLEMTPDAAESMTRKVERLLDFGFTQSEIAQVIGKKLNYVTAIVSARKKSRARTRRTG